MKPRSRNSRATGPKIRVPLRVQVFGCISTAALSSNLMYVPSGLRCGPAPGELRRRLNDIALADRRVGSRLTDIADHNIAHAGELASAAAWYIYQADNSWRRCYLLLSAWYRSESCRSILFGLNCDFRDYANAMIRQSEYQGYHISPTNHSSVVFQVLEIRRITRREKVQNVGVNVLIQVQATTSSIIRTMSTSVTASPSSSMGRTSATSRLLQIFPASRQCLVFEMGRVSSMRTISPSPAKVLRVVDVEPGHAAYLLAVQAMALFPHHLNHSCLVLLDPYHRTGTGLAPCSAGNH